MFKISKNIKIFSIILFFNISVNIFQRKILTILLIFPPTPSILKITFKKKIILKEIFKNFKKPDFSRLLRRAWPFLKLALKPQAISPKSLFNLLVVFFQKWGFKNQVSIIQKLNKDWLVFFLEFCHTGYHPTYLIGITKG